MTLKDLFLIETRGLIATDFMGISKNQNLSKMNLIICANFDTDNFNKTKKVTLYLLSGTKVQNVYELIIIY